MEIILNENRTLSAKCDIDHLQVWVSCTIMVRHTIPRL